MEEKNELGPPDGRGTRGESTNRFAAVWFSCLAHYAQCVALVSLSFLFPPALLPVIVLFHRYTSGTVRWPDFRPY
jgi:hypothetical protein